MSTPSLPRQPGEASTNKPAPEPTQPPAAAPATPPAKKTTKE